MISKRSVGLSIFLSLITCGIYEIYWFVKLTNETNQLSGDHKTSGGMAFLLTLITCGIYSLFWSYKMGKKMQIAQSKAGMPASDNSVLYLILNFFGLIIVSQAIIQSEINSIVERNYVAQ